MVDHENQNTHVDLKKLRNSETLFRSMYQASPLGIELYGPDGLLVDVNPTCLQIFGITDVTYVKGFNLFADPNISPKNKEELRQGKTARYEAPFDFEQVLRLNLYHTSRTGIIHLDVLITPLPADGDGPQGFMVQLHDVTARKQAEEDLLHSENLLASTINSLNEWVHVVDPDLRVVLMNAAFEAITREVGFEGNIIGTPLNEMFPFLANTIHDEYRVVFESSKPLINEEKTRVMGKTIHSETVKTPIIVDGKVIRVITMIRDITQKKETEKTLYASRKMADIGIMAAGMAHEINSPLQVITGSAETLLNNLEKYGQIDPTRLKKRLDTISENGWRIAGVVRSLMTYTHPPISKTETFSINDLVEDMLQIARPQFKSDAHINFQIALGTDIPQISCNQGELTQVLINLLTNARDAMPLGGVISIATGYDQAQDMVRLEIGNTGDVISQEIMDKIFDPFFTTKPMGQNSGLGLAVVQGIIHKYGGRITVTSSKEAGTLFNISLPYKMNG